MCLASGLSIIWIIRIRPTWVPWLVSGSFLINLLLLPAGSCVVVVVEGEFVHSAHSVHKKVLTKLSNKVSQTLVTKEPLTSSNQ